MLFIKRFTQFFFWMVVIFAGNARAQTTYSTLLGGSWNNPAIWSTDGITPCACTPGYTITNVIILLQHNVTLSTNLTIGNNAVVEITGSGTLSGLTRDIVVANDGLIETFGSLSVASVEIEIGGDGLFHDIVTCIDKFRVEGHAQIDTLVTVTDGDIEVKETGVLDILVPYIEVDVPEGEFKVDGILNLTNTCLYVLNGDFRNKLTGTINGSQYIEVLNGEIRDEGVWPASVAWCASGLATTMPFPENCSGCDLLLPLLLIDFTAIVKNKSVMLNWLIADTDRPTTFDIFSLTNQQWQQIGEQFGTAHQISFEWEDKTENSGIRYYQLGYYDETDNYYFSPIISVNYFTEEKIIYGYVNLLGEKVDYSVFSPPGFYIEVSNLGAQIIKK
jgi:hypothetical protein